MLRLPDTSSSCAGAQTGDPSCAQPLPPLSGHAVFDMRLIWSPAHMISPPCDDDQIMYHCGLFVTLPALQVPYDRRNPRGYQLLLTRLGMALVDRPSKGLKTEEAGQPKRRRSSAGEPSVWQQPAKLAGLRVDCAALAAALEQGDPVMLGTVAGTDGTKVIR